MPIEITPGAVEIFRRALEAGRMDPGRVGIRVAVVRGPRGDEVRTGFAEEPEASERTVDAAGIRVFVPADLEDRGATIDVSGEHGQIVLR